SARLDEATHLLESCLTLALDQADQGSRAQAWALRGAIGLLTADAESAISDLRLASTESTRFRNPTLLRHWADYVEACVATDRIGEAKGAVEAFERRLVGSQSRWGELALLRSRALVAEGESSLELFEACIAEFRPDESPYERGRTLLCLADRQRALGLSAQSTSSRMAAIAAFERSGALVWSAHAAQSELLAGSPLDVLQQFTVEEREVIRRVIDSQPTRAIAGGLHISTRTVELRLTAIYRALGVSSRAELVDLLT
ncbi:MAG: hypothetical protein QOJ72_2847, partial [Nocardioidaceae bacterium]|nr:hypothetical protein [Nocardioidaceae bacterium]